MLLCQNLSPKRPFVTYHAYPPFVISIEAFTLSHLLSQNEKRKEKKTKTTKISNLIK
jgi:hypothetical protein